VVANGRGLRVLPGGDVVVADEDRSLLVRVDRAGGTRRLSTGITRPNGLALGPGEMKSGGHRRDSILADAVEAIVGAIYFDAGFAKCRDAVLPWFEPAIAALPPPNKLGKDAKTRLQEWLQGRGKPLPVYRLIAETGDEHAKQFRVACVIAEPALECEGEGTSRRAAEQSAAEKILAVVDPAG